MAGLIPLPPSHVHTTTRLTHAQAHAHLSTFLANAENDAAYRPDSTLTERGPQSASTGTNPNLTLHHLRRILQGIEGKRIGGSVEDLSRIFGEEARLAGVGAGTGVGIPGAKKRKLDHDDQNQSSDRRRVSDENPENEKIGTGVAAEGEQDGWQDKEDYDLAQEDDEVDMLNDQRNPAANVKDPVDNEEAEEMAGVEIKETGRVAGLSEQHAENSTIDKKSRKEAKKTRRKAEKKAKEDARFGSR